MPDHITENLHPGEKNYYQKYIAACEKYNTEFGRFEGNEDDYGSGLVLDLFTDITPPKEQFIEVEVLKDLGAVFLPESGQVTLQKHARILLRRSEVDPLIKQGSVREVD